MTASRRIAIVGSLLACAGGALGQADGTVVFDLSSSLDGAIVLPGTVVHWTVTAKVTTGDNVGLALAMFEFVQDPNNPALFDLPPGDRAPEAMKGFDLPWGVANRGRRSSAYGGKQVGQPGAANLVQIGGAQNTLGAPLGSIGLDTDVDAGVGQASDGQVVATGSFVIPSTPGTYTFSILRPQANTLVRIQPAPEPSVVAWAQALVGSKVIRIRVECAADFTRDGKVNLFDFLDFSETFGEQDARADLDGSGVLDVFDFLTFVNAFNAGT